MNAQHMWKNEYLAAQAAKEFGRTDEANEHLLQAMNYRREAALERKLAAAQRTIEAQARRIENLQATLGQSRLTELVTDGNHTDVVKAVKSIGASVYSLADLGEGVPDVLVGFRGVTFLLEIKDGSKPPSKRKLTPAEREFFDTWRGKPPRIVYSPQDAIDYLMVETFDGDGIPF